MFAAHFELEQDEQYKEMSEDEAEAEEEMAMVARYDADLIEAIVFEDRSGVEEVEGGVESTERE